MLEVSDWREKSRFLQEFPKIAGIMGKDEFTDVFLDLLKESLSDRIYIVRQQAIAVINKLTSIFGAEWFLETVIFYLYAFKSDQNYLHRQTSLFCLQILSTNLIKHFNQYSGMNQNLVKQFEGMIDFLIEN